LSIKTDKRIELENAYLRLGLIRRPKTIDYEFISREKMRRYICYK